MITTEHIKQLIENGLSTTQSVEVTGHAGKYVAQVVSDTFAHLSLIQRHKLVYACVDHEITSGALHALTIIAKTPAEIT